MIITSISNSFLLISSPWDGMFCDLASIGLIRSITIIVLIHYDNTSYFPENISIDTEEYGNMFFMRFCQ